MRFDDLMVWMIDDYVNNEITYIYDGLDYDEQKKALEDLHFLESLNIDDYNNIYNKIQCDGKLIDEINDTIHRFLYEYQEEMRGKNDR